MLFTSPIFLFLFLPVTALFYAAIGKNLKRLSIFIFSLAFHLLFNLNHPANLLFLAGLYLFTLFAGMAAKKFAKSYLTFLLAALPFVYLVFLRSLVYYGQDSFIYPFGITFQVFSAVSYIIESGRRNTPDRGNTTGLLFYLTFFPVTFAGPIILYPDFNRLLKEENIKFNMKNASLGAKIFMIGFIKRVAVGAVLFDQFRKLTHLEKDSPNLIVSFVLMFILFFAVYFMFSGYSDMGVGIARIFGVRLYPDSSPPFGAPTPVSYFSSFFNSLHRFIEEYFLKPLRKKSPSRRYFLESAIYTLAVYLLLRARLYVLIVALPTIILMYFTERFEIKKRLGTKRGIGILFAALNAFVITVSFVLILVNDNAKIREYFRAITVFGSEYKFDQILIAISLTQLIFTIVVAFIVCTPRYRAENFFKKKLSVNVGGKFDYFVLFILLFLFAFTVMFFLPQYPEYDFSPFYYINL